MSCIFTLTIICVSVLFGCQSQDNASGNEYSETGLGAGDLDDDSLDESTNSNVSKSNQDPKTVFKDFSELKAVMQNIVSKYDATGKNTAITFEAVGNTSGGFQINGDESMIAASMIKLSILATLFDEINAGNVNFEDTLTAKSDDVVGGAGTHIAAGDTLTIEELASRMIAESDNTASNMLISHLGIDEINACAQQLGLTNTVLDHKLMTPNPAKDNLTSTNDLIALLKLIAEEKLGNPECSRKAQSWLLEQTDREALAIGISEDYMFGNKTGTLNSARSDAGIVFNSSGVPVAVIAVMTNHIDLDEANEMMAELASAMCEFL